MQVATQRELSKKNPSLLQTIDALLRTNYISYTSVIPSVNSEGGAYRVHYSPATAIRALSTFVAQFPKTVNGYTAEVDTSSHVIRIFKILVRN